MEVIITDIDAKVATLFKEGVNHIDDEVAEEDKMYLPNMTVRIEGPYSFDYESYNEKTCSIRIVGDESSLIRLSQIISKSISDFKNIHDAIQKEFGKKYLSEQELE